MNVKKIIAILLPSVLIWMIYFFVMSEDKYEVVKNPTDKITILLITNELCEECAEQEDLFIKAKNENTNELFKYDTLKIDSPVYNDIGDILGITSYPTVASFSSTGEVLYSNSDFHDEVLLERVKVVSQENLAYLKAVRNNQPLIPQDNTVKEENEEDIEVKQQENEDTTVDDTDE